VKPAEIAIAGTLAVHALIAVLGSALIEPVAVEPPDPRANIELVDITPPPIVGPAPPPFVPGPEPQPAATPPPPTPRAVPAPAQRVRATQPSPAREPQPPSPTPPSPDSGGGPVTQMEDIAPSARGIPVARGARQSGSGRGGTGTGTGSGVGAGSSEAPPMTASVATIKTRALPKGDFSYVDASKDYPPGARGPPTEGAPRGGLSVEGAGNVKPATLLNRLGHGLDELAMERAKKIQFEPAKDTNDQPVQSVVVWTFNMTLPK